MASVESNAAGKPRKGSFEVVLERDNKEPVVLYSKLESYGPAKNRDHIATPDAIIEKLKAYYPSKVR